MEILGGLLLLWLMGLGIAAVCQSHRRYLRATRRVLVYPFRYIWRHYRLRLFWFFLGFVFCLYLLAIFGAPTP